MGRPPVASDPSDSRLLNRLLRDVLLHYESDSDHGRSFHAGPIHEHPHFFIASTDLPLPFLVTFVASVVSGGSGYLTALATIAVWSEVEDSVWSVDSSHEQRFLVTGGSRRCSGR